MSWQDKIRNPNCELCPLHESADYVCLMGSGSRKAKVMVVGEAPGLREDEAHAAFVGSSGRLLRTTLEAAGIPPEDCYITNAAKCRPPENRTPTRTESKTCSSTYLSQELETVRPDYVLAVGNASLQALTRRSGITKLRGQLLQQDGYSVFPAFHPAYVLRSPQHEPLFQSDLQRFGRIVRGEVATADRTRIRIVQTTSQLKWLRRQLEEADVISFDLETSSEGTGKTHRYHRPWDPDGRIVMVGFSWREGEGVAVPLHHVSSRWQNPNEVLRYLKPALEDRGKKYVAHNGKFDCTWLASAGVFLEQTFDTMLAAHLLDENRLKGLKPLSQLLLGVEAYDVGEELKDAYNMDLRRLSTYQAKDVDYALRLYHRFREELLEHPRLARIFRWLMMPASNELVKVETVGMWCDPDRLEDQYEVYIEKRDKVEEVLRRKYGASEYNLRSPQQVSKWLFGDLGLDPIKETKTGAPSTDESSMLQLDHPACRLLLKYRTYESKYLRTYLRAWDESRDAKSRVHTNYKLFGTVTGRLSSERPNLQQVPRESSIRSVFGARQGWTLIEADYSQIELRVAAMLSRDETLLRIFATGGDPHLTTAAEISGLTEGEVIVSDAAGKTEHRKKAKPVNFGFLYGMGAAKFVSYAFDNYGQRISEGDALRYRKRYFALYSRLLDWHERQRRTARALGYVTSPLGRIRHLPGVWSDDDLIRSEAERQAINSPVQSTASDLMLLSMVRLGERLPFSQCRAVGTVHDALLFECRESYLAEGTETIRSVMEDTSVARRKFGADITVSIQVEIKVGQYWGSGTVV